MTLQPYGYKVLTVHNGKDVSHPTGRVRLLDLSALDERLANYRDMLCMRLEGAGNA